MGLCATAVHQGRKSAPGMPWVSTHAFWAVINSANSDSNCLLAGRQAGGVLVSLQGPVLVDRQNDGVNLPRFFDKHWPLLGLSANAAKSVLASVAVICMSTPKD